MRQVCYPNPYGAIICVPESGRNIFMQDLFGLQGGGGGGKFVQEYQDVIDYAISQNFELPSDAVMQLQNELVKSLVEDGIWNELDVFYNFLGDGSEQFALINWKNPGTFTAINNGAAYQLFDGFKGNGVNAYLDTQFIPSGGINLTLNDSSFFTAMAQLTPENTGMVMSFGPSVTDYFGIRPRYGDSNTYAWVNSAFAKRVLRNNAPSNYFAHVQRVSSLTANLFQNGILNTSNPASDVGALSPAKIYLIAESNNNVAQNFSTGVIRCFGAGASLQGAELTLYNDWATYVHNVALIAYTPEYVNVLTYAATQGFAYPSANIRLLQDKLIQSLKAQNIWSRFDLFYNFLGDGDENFAKINWVAPGTFPAINQAATYAINTGFTTTNTLGVQTNYLPDGLGKWKLNDASYSGDYTFPLTGDFNPALGWNLGSRSMVRIPRQAPDRFDYSLNDTNETPTQAIAANVSEASFTANRLDANTKQLFFNGVDKGQAGVPSQALPNTAPGYVANGGFGTVIVRYFAAGGSLGNQSVNLYSTWNEYKNFVASLGAYKTILDYATTQGFMLPSVPVQIAGVTYIKDLMVAGIWNQLDVLYNFVTDGDENFAKINWKKPGTNQLPAGGSTFTPLNSLIFTAVADTGYQPDGVTSNYKLDDASVFSGALLPSGLSANLLNNVGTDNISLSYFPSGVFYTQWVMNEQAARNVVVIDRFNLFCQWQRTAADSSRVIERGVAKAPGNQASVALPITTFKMSATGSLNNQVFGAGASLVGKEQKLFDAWQNYSVPLLARVEYKKITDYATSQAFALPSEAVQAKQITLLEDLIRAGIWNELDLFYNFLTDGDEGFAKINWKNPGAYPATLKGDASFIPNVGIDNGVLAGGGIGTSLWSGLNNGVNFKLNSLSAFGAFGNVPTTGNYDLFGDAAGAPRLLLSGFGVGYFSTYGNPEINPSLNIGKGDAVWMIQRKNATNQTVFKNGNGAIASSAIGTGALVATEVTAGITLGQGHANNMKIKMFGLGGTCEGKELALSTAWSIYEGGYNQ